MRLLPMIALTSVVMAGGFIIGCSPVQFSTVTNQACSNGACANPAAQGSPSPGSVQDYTVTDPTTAPVDILVVDDNSGSMAPDQQTLGSKFPSLFNLISQNDYHVAITTTDVSGTGLPGRDGTLVSFSDGSQVLNWSSSNPASLFQTGVQRPETATCWSYLQKYNFCAASGSCSDYYTYCPSDDSRAIYAANLVVSNNPSGFIRPNGVLNVIVVSNSDERILGGNASNKPLETNDLPATLASNVQNQFPGKTLRVHTLVIRQGDQACLNSEAYSGQIFGQYAPVYETLASLTGGVDGSVCVGAAGTYDAQLQQMGLSIQNTLLKNISLNCQTTNANLAYSFTPASSITATVDSSGQNLVLSSPLPQGTSIHLHYTCN